MAYIKAPKAQIKQRDKKNNSLSLLRAQPINKSTMGMEKSLVHFNSL